MPPCLVEPVDDDHRGRPLLVGTLHRPDQLGGVAPAGIVRRDEPRPDKVDIERPRDLLDGDGAGVDHGVDRVDAGVVVCERALPQKELALSSDWRTRRRARRSRTCRYRPCR